MNLTTWAQGHARSLLFLFAVLALAGAISSFQLPVGLFPQANFPRIRVTLDAGDLPAERMAIEMTTPVEEAVRSIPGVKGLRSTTSRGSAEVIVDFDWGQDIVSALFQVESKVNKLMPTLPSGTTFEAERMNPTVFPAIAYSLTSETHTLTELRDLAYLTLRPVLTTVPGVARVEVQGGEKEEYRVVLDLSKVQAFGLTTTDIASALSAANVLVAVGKLQQDAKLYLVVSDTRFRKFEEIGHTVLRSSSAGVILLSDVASIERSVEPQWTRVIADGKKAVLLQVYQQPDGNTVAISEQVKAKLRAMKAQLPPGIHIANWYDQSVMIRSSAASARDTVLLGIGLAAIVLFVFLRNWKVTLIAALTVPVALSITILLLSVLGMSFNMMTLGGMAAAVGLIIDDAIVMIEHLVRRMREGIGIGDIRSCLLEAAKEFSSPLLGSSAATIIIFTPLAFLSGVTGAFFKALSLTMASGLTISFLVSWLAVPILCVHVLTEKDGAMEEEGRWMHHFEHLYEGTMRRLFEKPWLILLFIGPLVVAGVIAGSQVSSGFMPSMDEGGFTMDYVSAPGTSLVETDRMLTQVEAIIKATPEVATYSRRTGLQLGGGITEANTGDYFIRLKPQPRRDVKAVMEDIRSLVMERVPGLDVETLQLTEDLIGDLTGVPQPIEIKIYDDSQEALDQLAPKVAAAIGQIPGVVEVKDGIVPAGDAMNIKVDRVKASLEGMSPDTISQTITDFLSGKVITGIQSGAKMINVRIWTPEAAQTTEQDLKNMLLRAPDGHLFPLKRVASFTTITGQPQITRDNLKRMVAVTARITGRDLGSTINDVKKTLSRAGFLPKTVSYSLGGLYEQQQIAFRGLSMILLVAFVLVFLLLLFLYESFRVAGAMLLTTLLAVAGVYVGLWITGTEFNIISRMGMTMIVGIVTEVAIFYYSEYLELPTSPARYIQAGLNRMRPILMTTLAAIFALSPLALGIGEGSAMLQPLAIAIIFGLFVQLPLVLVVLPVFLSLSRRTITGNAVLP